MNSDKLKDKVVDSASKVSKSVKDTACKVADTAKSATSLAVHEVRDHAQDAADKVKKIVK